MPIESDAEIEDILDLRRVAVVGCSRKRGKDAHDVPAYLNGQGYEIIPVNPNADAIFGRSAYDTLSAVPPTVDIVNVFRPSGEVASIVDAVLARPDAPVLWLQRGIHDAAAIRRAENAGIRVIAGRCMRSEHRRLSP